MDSAIRLAHLNSQLTDDVVSRDPPADSQSSAIRCEQTQSGLVTELQQIFLNPPAAFTSSSWLDKLQSQPEIQLDSFYSKLFQLPSSQTRSVTRFIRAGIDGKIVGHELYTSPRPLRSENSKNSSSFARAPSGKSDFVQGRSGFRPFAPGGLDPSIAIRASEIQAAEVSNFVKRDSNGLFSIPPGLTRGLKIVDDSVDNLNDNIVVLEESYENAMSPSVENAQSDNGSELLQIREIVAQNTVDPDLIDELLPTESIKSLLEMQYHNGRSSLLNGSKREWAHVVDVKTKIENFNELVPQLAREYPFELDTFQKEAVYHLEQGDSVFVAAHTSAGKTVVAEYAIAMASRNMTKAIYTSPIKALSNQKFRDFKQIFDDVGVLTGDVQINPEASCLIMTTEILRSMLYRGADLIRDVEFVIFDEVHYVNDLERGVVWEEVIIMLPDHIKLILLSATVPNTYEFASWVGRTKRKDIYVISTLQRPVPLEHFIWAKDRMFKLVDSQKRFLMQGWSDAEEALNPLKNAPQSSQSQRGGRGGSLPRGSSRGGARGGARGGPVSARGRGAFLNNQGGFRNNASFDKNAWLRLARSLEQQKLLPVVIFVFSRKKVEEYANSLISLNYCNAKERAQIRLFIDNAVSRLKKEDQSLPQILRMREMLSRGIAVHHSGLLPIVKEVVEILFSKTLVKVLFATETFAMGLNLPTRTVVFSATRKHDGRTFRSLLPGEYTQMAGRAGRRGLDTTGTVIIAVAGDQMPPTTALNTMILGQPTKLQSQFRLTYNMMLNLLRVEELKVEEMIKRSFSENASQSLIPEHEDSVKQSEANLKSLNREPCDICDTDLQETYEAMQAYKQNAQKFSETAPARLRSMLVSVQMPDSSRTLCFVIDVDPRKLNRFTVCGLFPRKGKGEKLPSDAVPFVPEVRHLIGDLVSDGVLVERVVPASAIEMITDVKLGTNLMQKISKRDQKAVVSIRKKLLEASKASFNLGEWCPQNFPELVEERRKLREKISKANCLNCPNFIKHFVAFHEEALLRKDIQDLKNRISDQNLELLPDYMQRIDVLKDLAFIDQDMNVELKGKVACEVNSGHELIVTELILENFLAEYEPEEIAALLSCFVFDQKSQVIPRTLTHSLEEGKAKIIEIARRVNDVQLTHQIATPQEMLFDPENCLHRFGLMEVVYEWARGMPFSQITGLTDVLEGTIVRVITRLDEVCREVKSASRLIGDPTLHSKMELTQEKIKRDIVFCSSLYL
ncbi:NUC185 domain-containing protein [Lipomyces oligophaga]|uniref:NUC185 domain-containing protein n=1 Tax=Lipomyces oligophaga TaxID=45792 RepID=UPI0034CFEF5C